MKRSSFTLLTAAALVLGGSALAQETTLTLDQIVQKHVQAMGGAAKLKSVKTMKLTGSASVSGMDAPTVMIFKRPDKARLDMTINDQQFIQAVDASSGWNVNPFTGSPDPQPLSDEMAADFRSGGEIEGPLVDYQAKGSTLDLLGTDKVNGKPAYKLKLVRKGGRSDVLYIDTQTFMQVKAVSRRNIMGQDTDVETYTSDFKDVDGVKIPHTIEQRADGNSVFAMTITKVEMNGPVDDSIFAKPAKK